MWRLQSGNSISFKLKHIIKPQLFRTVFDTLNCVLFLRDSLSSIPRMFVKVVVISSKASVSMFSGTCFSWCYSIKFCWFIVFVFHFFNVLYCFLLSSFMKSLQVLSVNFKFLVSGYLNAFLIWVVIVKNAREIYNLPITGNIPPQRPDQEKHKRSNLS